MLNGIIHCIGENGKRVIQSNGTIDYAVLPLARIIHEQKV